MFFTQISLLMTQGVDLTLVLRKTEQGLLVSALPKSNGLADAAQNHLVPLSLSGTPEELDAGFLSAVSAPIERASGLIVRLEQFERQAAKASAESKAQKEAQGKEDKQTKERREKCDKLVRKSEEAAALGQYAAAVGGLQQALAFAEPDVRQAIEEKIADWRAKSAQGSLFAAEEPQPPIVSLAEPTPPPTPNHEPIPTPEPQACRADEYDRYPDFPAAMAPMFHSAPAQVN